MGASIFRPRDDTTGREPKVLAGGVYVYYMYTYRVRRRTLQDRTLQAIVLGAILRRCRKCPPTNEKRVTSRKRLLSEKKSSNTNHLVLGGRYIDIPGTG